MAEASIQVVLEDEQAGAISTNEQEHKNKDGISFSARDISLLPNSARFISATL